MQNGKAVISLLFNLCLSVCISLHQAFFKSLFPSECKVRAVKHGAGSSGLFPPGFLPGTCQIPTLQNAAAKCLKSVSKALAGLKIEPPAFTFIKRKFRFKSSELWRRIAMVNHEANSSNKPIIKRDNEQFGVRPECSARSKHTCVCTHKWNTFTAPFASLPLHGASPRVACKTPLTLIESKRSSDYLESYLLFESFSF